MSGGKLTPRQARFVEEYQRDRNGTQAAIRSGYSAKTAEASASRMLRNVKVSEAIKEADQARAERLQITADEILERAWKIAQSDDRDRVPALALCAKRFPEFNRSEQTIRTNTRPIAEWTDAELEAALGGEEVTAAVN